MATPSFNVGLLTPATDLVTGASNTEFDLLFGRAGNDIFYGYDPISDANANLNIDILFGDLFDNSPDEFNVILQIANGNPLAILNANIPSAGNDRHVLGNEFQPFYTAADPASVLATNPFGLNEFAVVYDFAPGVDTIQLNGNRKDYALLKVDGLPIPNVGQFSGYALFSLQTGLPDLVSLIVQKPEVTLDLKEKYFQFVGTKPKEKPKDKKIAQFGTTGLDFGYGVAADASGNVFVAGSTSGSLFGANQGSGDVWVAKYDRSGNQIFGFQFGSSDGDTPYRIVTDKDGNFYMAGNTSGSLVAGKQSSRGSDAWVAKFNSSGQLLWGRQVGEAIAGGFSTTGFGLQVDDQGNVYLSGLTIKDNPPPRFLDFEVEDDSFVMKFDTNGNQQWFTKISDPEAPSPFNLTPFFDENYDISTDTSGNSYLSGWTQGLSKEADPSRDLLKYDAWLSRVDTNGQILWTQQFGSRDQGVDFAWANATDSQGNIYVTGWTTGTIGASNFGSYDVWLTKFTPEGTQVWAKQIGTTADDGGFLMDLAIDASDNLFISGYTNGKLGKGAADKAYNAWVGRFDTNGNNQWIQKLGVKDKAEYGTRLAVNNTGQVIVTGYTEGFLGTSGNAAAQGAAVDAWVAQLNVRDGKLQNFAGNTGSVDSIVDPSPIPTVDISGRLVTADKLPDGDNRINSPGGSIDYGKLLPNLAPAFDPRQQNSIPTALRNSGILDNSMLNSSTKVEYKGTDKDDVYFGSTVDDKLEGAKGIDVLYGRGGNDELKGNDQGDFLYGNDGADKLDGGNGDDVLSGGAGNDEVKGGKGIDTLLGIDADSPLSGFGAGELDKLEGGEDADLFVLGDSSRSYYIGQGNGDYALIDDFKRDQSDKIQLNGGAGNYRLETDGSGLPKGIAIFATANNDLVGVVKDAKGLSLTDTNVFTFV